MVSAIQPSPLAGEHADWLFRLGKELNDREWSSNLTAVVEKLGKNEPLNIDDGMLLHAPGPFGGRCAAHAVRRARFGDQAFFNSNVHINQTNICVLACKFCAFRRGPKANDAYAMSIDDYLNDLDTYAHAIDEVHSVGGLHPDWGVEHYESMFQAAKKRHPHVSIKALTAVEIKHLGQKSSIPTKSVLSRLKSAGLTSLPGGGAEILDDDVRAIICNGKESSDEYLQIHREAHEVGLPSNCTMLFGTIERLEQRLQHMISLRELNEETRGFQCFVPYPFLPDHPRLPEAQLATVEILRTIAVSRLMLNNIPTSKPTE